MTELDLLEISFMNMVYYYRYQLMRVQRGSLASKVFPEPIMKSLARNRILVPSFLRGRQYRLSDKTSALLQVYSDEA